VFFEELSYLADHVGRPLLINIGGEQERMPAPLIQAFGVLKKAAAQVNATYGALLYVLLPETSLK
jgi:fumarate hydratase class II